jgi:nucleosome binding factor SPN SPT16 subunit
METKAQSIKAFLSCSLRVEDKPFIDLVESILLANNIIPFGTVGKYSASPENPTELMRKNIHSADIAIIVVTPRYNQKDIGTNKEYFAPSEMIHSEVAMAYMANKPVVVFVKEGTDVGSFISNITQYIVLEGTFEDYLSKQILVKSLLENTSSKLEVIQDNEFANDFRDFIITAFALYGGYSLLKNLSPVKPETSILPTLN